MLKDFYTRNTMWQYLAHEVRNAYRCLRFLEISPCKSFNSSTTAKQQQFDIYSHNPNFSATEKRKLNRVKFTGLLWSSTGKISSLENEKHLINSVTLSKIVVFPNFSFSTLKTKKASMPWCLSTSSSCANKCVNHWNRSKNHSSEILQ